MAVGKCKFWPQVPKYLSKFSRESNKTLFLVRQQETNNYCLYEFPRWPTPRLTTYQVCWTTAGKLSQPFVYRLQTVEIFVSIVKVVSVFLKVSTPVISRANQIPTVSSDPCSLYIHRMGLSMSLRLANCYYRNIMLGNTQLNVSNNTTVLCVCVCVFEYNILANPRDYVRVV